MAKKTDIKAPASSMRRGSTGKAFVWVILVLLILGLAGFGANGIGGSISSLGSVGKTDIPIADYQRALQQELSFESRRRGQQVSMQQARLEGIDQRVLDRLAGGAALSEEARVVGLSVGDDEVATQLRGVPAFQGTDGQFSRENYEFALRQNGIGASEFEDQLRVTAARDLLQQAVTGGLTVPETYAQTVYGFLQESRSFRWALVEPSLLDGDAPAPTEAELASFHEERAAQFRTPETRKLTYAWLTPDMLLDTIELDEDELQRLYDERSDQYIRPARRLIERLGFSDMEAAGAAKAQIDAGDTTFDALIEERGLTLQDVDQGEVSRADLDAAVADAVFALTEPGVSEPVTTSLGPVLYRVNAILQATEVTFEEARPDLVAEFTADRARRIIEDEITAVDDLLVGGATLEELANETPMEVGALDLPETSGSGIALYQEFREEAARLTVGDFPEVRELSDGGIFAVRLDELVAPALPPLAEIRDAVSEAWAAEQQAQRLSDLGAELVTQIESGTRMASLDLAARAERDLSRTDFIEDAPLGMLAAVFDLDAPGITFVQSPDGLSAVVELLDISQPDLTTDQAQAVTSQLNGVASEGLAADVFEVFGRAVQTRHGLSLDQTAVNAVLSQFGGGTPYGGS